MLRIDSDRPLRILHLEDSQTDQILASLTLRKAGISCSIKVVESLEDFCRLLESESFDLILADYRLPGFTAIDAWNQVCQKPAAPPFVLLSGAIGEAAAVDAIRLGIADYLLKDDISRLPHVITRALEVHEARAAREHAMRELAASQQRLAELAEHLQSSIEQERATIAREIHDDIGGSLSAIRFDLGWIARHATDPGIKDHVAAASDMLQHAIGASQRIMMNLRPAILDQGLVAAVQWLADSFERRTAVPTQVHKSAETIAVSKEVQLVAYRTAQEALTNIAKYANPSKVRIELSDSEGFLTLEVTDDGCGIAPEMLNKPKAFGLKGLQERAATVQGWLDISSQPGRGTSVILSVPVSPTPEI